MRQRNEERENNPKKTIWFNPPWSIAVKTNIGKRFFTILDTCFPKNHPYHKIFNRHTVKLSYSCMTNMERIIKAHNSKILRNNGKQQNSPKKTCSCPKNDRENCPLKGKCLQKNVVYKATISETNKDDKFYFGSTATCFKQRLYNHRASFKHKEKRDNTELAKHVWKIKESGGSFDLKWEIVEKVPQMNHAEAKCNLCLTEKFYILTNKAPGMLNKRSELKSRCTHLKKFFLNRFQYHDGGSENTCDDGGT